ncbi:MAG: hypothetical protein QQN44_06715 [Nitrosopumilus sp.]
METKIYFDKWSEKLSIPVEGIQSEFDEILKNEKEIHKELDDEGQQKRALQRLALLYKKQLRSPAIGFEGMVIGVGDLFDTVRRMRNEAISTFKKDQQHAVTAGITDEMGVPLDTREVFGTGRENSSFGKPLPEHSYIRTVIGVALRTNVKETPKLFTMTLNGDKAEHCEIEMFKPIKFRAIDKSEEGSDNFVLNGSTVTKFEVSDKIKMPTPIEVLRNVCKNMFIPLSDIDSYHQTNKDDFNRLALIEGDVSILNTEPTAFGSRMMAIEDMDKAIDNLDIPGLTCWIPSSVDIDFAEGSKVIVVGRTAQGKSRDDPNVLGDVMMNVLGIYAIPEFKIEPEEDMTPEEADEAIKGIAIAETDAEATQVSTVPEKSTEEPASTSGW